MHVIDKATGCVFVAPAGVKQPRTRSDKPASQRSNMYTFMTLATGPIPTHGPRSDVHDVQERWIDAKEECDAWEKAQEEAARQRQSGIREQTSRARAGKED